MQHSTPLSPHDMSARNASKATLDLVEALERAADVLRRSLATTAGGEVAAPGVSGSVGVERAVVEPTGAATPADFALAMRRVEAEYYDAA
jgi:hypothetical protein